MALSPVDQADIAAAQYLATHHPLYADEASNMIELVYRSCHALDARNEAATVLSNMLARGLSPQDLVDLVDYRQKEYQRAAGQARSAL